MSDPGTAHLLGRVGVVEERIRTLIQARRAVDPNPDDPFRGLYLTDELVDRLVERGPDAPVRTTESARRVACEQQADTAEAAGHRIRLRELAQRFELTPLDVELLLVAVAADLDRRFESLFGYLNDDVTRRRPSVALALELCGEGLSSPARSRLRHGPLITGRLVEIDDDDRPFPTRSLRVPDRVVGHLLGDDADDPRLATCLREAPTARWGDSADLERALGLGIRIVHLSEAASGSGPCLAAGAFEALGSGALHVDLARLNAERDPVELAELVRREARLTGRGIVAGPVAHGAVRTEVLDVFCADGPPVVFYGGEEWDPEWCDALPLFLRVEPSTHLERVEIWSGLLGPIALDVDLPAQTAPFRLRPDQVARAARSAVIQARIDDDGRVSSQHIGAGARAENGAALDRLTRHVRPTADWFDLVLPASVRRALEEVSLRARHRERVLGDWEMRPGGGRGRGVVALFAGDSGTGKTMSAEVVAKSLALDLYVVDLSSVIDKYVGETEKNLERIFSAASGINGVLLFDEADAVFGKRSDVKDAHDRYANIESAYLLQRLESFDGLAILSTNLRANIDAAFTRRLDVVVDFPLPDAAHRELLWDRCLGRIMSRSADIDLGFLGRSFELAGGSIRAAATTAAYLASEADTPVTMAHLITAVQREYRKLGRLTMESEFGDYWSLVDEAR